MTLTPAQRFMLESASDAELFQAIAHARTRHGTHIVLAGAVWDWGDWGNWLQTDIVAPAQQLLDEKTAEIRKVVCEDWNACAKLPGLSSQFETASQIAEVLLLFVTGIVGKLLARGVAMALAYILAERGLGAFCGCKP